MVGDWTVIKNKHIADFIGKNWLVVSMDKSVGKNEENHLKVTVLSSFFATYDLF